MSNQTGSANVAVGRIALFSATTNDSSNTAVGTEALQSLTTGIGNIALGVDAGSNLTAGGTNIYIGNAGAATESNITRIGSGQTKTFIAGIRGTTTGNADAIAVVIDSAGQLGTVSSSERFKREIKPMDKSSEALLALKPVTFHYKNDRKGIPQFGLIAEEVSKVTPDLVVRDTDGKPYTVRYDAVNAMLLNEFLKEHKTVAELKSIVAEQRKGMEQMATQLKEQAAQIQKVSAQLEVSKSAPQTVLNNQ
jgi:hypothetical protein